MRIAMLLLLGLLVILILLPFNWSKYDFWSIVIAVIVSLALMILQGSTSILESQRRIAEQGKKTGIAKPGKVEVPKVRIRCPRCDDEQIYPTHRKWWMKLIPGVANYYCDGCCHRFIRLNLRCR